MTTVTITSSDLLQRDEEGGVLSPIIEDNFRAYGNYAKISGFNVVPINNAPAYIYLTAPEGVDAYVMDDPLGGFGGDVRYFIATGHPDLGNLGQVDTDDTITTNVFYSSLVFAGIGDDTIEIPIYSNGGPPVFGGSGNDTINLNQSFAGGTVYGDFADAPIFVSDTQWTIPTSADPAVLDGDDNLLGSTYNDSLFGGGGNDSLWGNNGNDSLVGGSGDDTMQGAPGIDTLDGESGNDILLGQKGPDLLVGGDGNDQLDGGPRGSGWQDTVFGGAGSDMFYLNYQQDSNASSEAQYGFWGPWAEDFVSQEAGMDTTAIVKKLAETAAEDFFKNAVAGTVLGLAADAVGALVTGGLTSLFSHTPPTPPQPTAADIAIIADFDPSEDSLYLPIDEADKELLTVAVEDAPSIPGLDPVAVRKAAVFQKVENQDTTTYAVVVLDDDFVKEFDPNLDDATTQETLLKNVFDTSLVFDSNGIVNPASANPYLTVTDPDDYIDGQPPAGIAETIDITAPDGTYTKIYGAFGPLTALGSELADVNVTRSGTIAGDMLFVTKTGFAPNQWDDAQVVAEVTTDSTIKGFGGDDIINGSKGEDSLFGGDGDDLIYGWDVTGGTDRDQLHGDAGDDTLFAAKPGGENPAAQADFYGGDGSDTASFAYSRWNVDATLVENENGTGTGVNGGDTAPDPAYTFTDIENLTGTALNDTLTGDGNDNIIDGGPGNDTLAGGDGSDVYSMLTTASEAWVFTMPESFGNGTFTDLSGGVDTISGLEGVGGTRYDDQLTGNSGENGIVGFSGDDTLFRSPGDDTLDGGADSDTVNYAASAGALQLDLNSEPLLGPLAGFVLAREYAGTNPSGTVAYIDAVGNVENITGSAFNDQISGDGNDNIIDGGTGNDLLAGGEGLDVYSVLTTASVPWDFIMPESFGNGTVTDPSGGVDTISGFEGVGGTPFNDLLEGNSDDNRILGFDGNDTLYGQDGNDSLSGNDGLDQIQGGAGNDTLYGDDGNDTVWGNDGFDEIWGGAGSDVFPIAPPPLDSQGAVNYINDFVQGVDLIGLAGGLTFGDLNLEDDIVYDFPGGNAVLAVLSYGGTAINASTLTQNDFVTIDPEVAPAAITDGGGGTSGDDFIFGSAEADTLAGLAGHDSLNGNDGSDAIDGGSGSDVIDGGGDNDMIRAGSGDDTATGGAGDDSALGGSGDDVLAGADGNDLIIGGGGHDDISGGTGADTLTGSNGNDTAQGGPGDDSLVGDADSDNIAGGMGDDTIEAGSQDDTVAGDGGNDRLYGNGGDDLMDGGDGDDVVSGRGGDDMLTGGSGTDTLHGGDGDDLYVLQPDQGTDRIMRFSQGEDLIGLAGGLMFDDLTFEGSAIIADGETLATVDAVDATTLTEFDFVVL
jgi:Ca2+-binding RTX toxin-like protein